MTLPLDDIQGLILRGYGMDAMRVFILRTQSAADARTVLAALPVAQATPWEMKPATCVNVALTFAGLRALGLPDATLAGFPEEFRAGAAARAEFVGDTDESAPATWRDGFASDDAHAIVLLFARDGAARETCADDLRARFAGAFTEIAAYDADMLPGNLAHFGFRDGFSQPTIADGLPNPVPEITTPAPAGAFVLGYPSPFAQFSYPVPQPPAFGMNGSFLALRMLAQDCAAFERLLASAPQAYGIDGELLAAKMVGRRRNGTPLELIADPTAPDPVLAPEAMNAYDYTEDPRGLRCPVGAHMRRANPRNSVVAGGGGLKHRIVRRGLPYGPPFDPARPDDGIERGLLGLFLCASLKDQFEFLMEQWVNGDTFAPGIAGTKDPILGNHADGAGKFVIPVAGAEPIVVSGFSRLVRTRGAAYAFLPSIGALRALGTSP